ncbi:hypothetical protein OROMI_006008 [Orobanche minor]
MKVVEQGMGGDELALQSTNYHPYPPPMATYEDVLGSRDLFMDTLKKFHASMGTKFMIPIVGGRDLDLHRLFVEVTSRGGIAKEKTDISILNVLKDKRWKEVTSAFSFPSSATNASFILRKYYVSLLYHYEQIYVFKAKCWTPSPSGPNAGARLLIICADTMQHLSAISSDYVPSAIPQTHAAANTSTSIFEESLAPTAGSPVCGVIDGKFDSGYLITVRIGSEEFKGVLYQVPPPAAGTKEELAVKPAGGAPRRKRRKKSEIRRRDPAHPKPNRSGYNFFFAEQHARLKPHYHGKDREISRIIGETWNQLQEPERAVYQEKALKDKERYRIEMEDYRERLRSGQIPRNAVPIIQHPPVPEINSTDLNNNLHFGSAGSDYNEDNEMGSDKISSEEYESADKESDFGECSQADTELKTVNIEVMADDEAFDLQTRPNMVEPSENGTLMSGNNHVDLGEDGVSVLVEEIEQAHSSAHESVPPRL